MKTSISILLLMSSITIFAQDRVGEYPPSRRYAPFIKEVTKQKFDQAIIELKNIYIDNDGLSKIVFDPRWENSFTVAYAAHRQGKWIIYVNGGMARAIHMTMDSFKMLLCHEVGHLVGGAPFATGNRWAAAEGQADYFAASKCMKRVLKDKDNHEFLKDKNIPTHVIAACQDAYSDINSQNICQRTALAGINLTSAFSYMLNEAPPSVDTVDNSTVSQTLFDDYPSRRIRARNRVPNQSIVRHVQSEPERNVLLYFVRVWQFCSVHGVQI